MYFSLLSKVSIGILTEKVFLRINKPSGKNCLITSLCFTMTRLLYPQRANNHMAVIETNILIFSLFKNEAGNILFVCQCQQIPSNRPNGTVFWSIYHYFLTSLPGLWHSVSNSFIPPEDKKLPKNSKITLEKWFSNLLNLLNLLDTCKLNVLFEEDYFQFWIDAQLMF